MLLKHIIVQVQVAQSFLDNTMYPKQSSLFVCLPDWKTVVPHINHELRMYFRPRGLPSLSHLYTSVKFPALACTPIV
jgi:hypothetical protein